jgi:DNA invertase Pin-like site-specific DNA recombinase
MKRNYAYLRVNTKEQNLARQIDSIQQLNKHINESLKRNTFYKFVKEQEEIS